MFVTRVALADGARVTDASVCIFESMHSMVSLCRILYARGLGGESAAYALPEGAFALILPEFDRDERLPLEATVINEFGYRRDCEKIEGYIKEHARTIFAENAVARLAEFA